VTRETRAAISRVRIFLAAWDERHTARDQVLAQVKPGSADMLTSDDLRALLAAVAADQQPPGRRAPLTDEPSGVIPTPRGLDYLAIRRQQHPKQATDD
jgi:hypothetical protein